MGNFFSMYSGNFFSDTFGCQSKVDEDKWLEIENVPCENSLRKAAKRSKKNADKYGESLRPVDRSQIRCEMSLEERMYMDMFGGASSSGEDCRINGATEGKKSDEELQLSELIFENKSGEDSDNLSCCDGESSAIHTEDLVRRGVTRQIASEIAYECRHLARQDSERNANQLKSSQSSSSSQTVAQHLAKTGQFVSAEMVDSKDHAKEVNADLSSSEPENQDENAKKPKCSRLKKLRRKRRKATAKVDPSLSETDPAQTASPRMKQVSDIYKMFESKSPDVNVREVLSIEEGDDGPANDVENTDATASAVETTKKPSKSLKFWRRGKTKVKKFKTPRETGKPSENETNKPSEDEATTSNDNAPKSKFNIFKKKKKTPVKPFKKEEDGEKEKWRKVKMSATVMPTPKGMYSKK